MTETDPPEFILCGAVPTAPEPPCFAYPLFRKPRGNKEVFFQRLQNYMVVGFDRVGQTKFVKLKRKNVLRIGDKALLCLKLRQAKFVVGTYSEMQAYVRDIVSSKKVDRFPVFKRSLQHFIGDEGKLEDANAAILEKYQERRPRAMRYFVLNDVIRTYVKNQLEDKHKETFEITKLIQINDHIDLEFPLDADHKATQAIAGALQNSLQNSRTLRQFAFKAGSRGARSNLAEYEDFDYDSGEFDFPFNPSFVDSIANSRRFFVPEAYDFIHARLSPRGAKRYGYYIYRNKPYEVIRPVDLIGARKLASLRELDAHQLSLFHRAKADTIFVSDFSLDEEIGGFIGQKKTTTSAQFEALKIAIMYAVPIGAIVKVLTSLGRFSLPPMHTFIRIGVKSPPADLSRAALRSTMVMRPISDSSLIKELKVELDI
jgi:hypothetical protein